MVLRLESIGYVIVGAIAMLALGFLIVLGPLIFATALKYVPWLAPLENTFTFLRYAVATVVLIISLLLVHKWLPGGRRRLREIMPGIIATLFLWLICGVTFGRYLARIRLHLCHLLCRSCLGDDRAGVSLFHVADLRVRRRIQLRDQEPFQGDARAARGTERPPHLQMTHPR